MTTDPLFQPFKLLNLTLQNRIMAPMTRSKSPDGVPGSRRRSLLPASGRGRRGADRHGGDAIPHPAAVFYPDVPRFYGDNALAGGSERRRGGNARGGRGDFSATVAYVDFTRRLIRPPLGQLYQPFWLPGPVKCVCRHHEVHIDVRHSRSGVLALAKMFWWFDGCTNERWLFDHQSLCKEVTAHRLLCGRHCGAHPA